MAHPAIDPLPLLGPAPRTSDVAARRPPLLPPFDDALRRAAPPARDPAPKPRSSAASEARLTRDATPRPAARGPLDEPPAPPAADPADDFDAASATRTTTDGSANPPATRDDDATDRQSPPDAATAADEGDARDAQTAENPADATTATAELAVVAVPPSSPSDPLAALVADDASSATSGAPLAPQADQAVGTGSSATPVAADLHASATMQGSDTTDDADQATPAAEVAAELAPSDAPPRDDATPGEDANIRAPTGAAETTLEASGASATSAVTTEGALDGDADEPSPRQEAPAAKAPAAVAAAEQAPQNSAAASADGASEGASPQDAVEESATDAPAGEVAVDATPASAAADAEAAPVGGPNGLAADGAVPEGDRQAPTAASQSVAPATEPGRTTALERMTRGPWGLSGGTAAADGRATTPVDAARFLNRVSGAMQLAHQRDGKVQVRLSPPELGALRIELVVQDGALTAQIETETSAARAALLDNLPALRDRLAEQQIRIERFQVDVGRDDNAAAGRQFAGEGHPQRDGQRQPAPPATPLRAAAPEVVARGAADALAPLDDGTLDVRI